MGNANLKIKNYKNDFEEWSVGSLFLFWIKDTPLPICSYKGIGVLLKYRGLGSYLLV